MQKLKYACKWIALWIMLAQLFSYYWILHILRNLSSRQSKWHMHISLCLLHTFLFPNSSGLIKCWVQHHWQMEDTQCSLHWQNSKFIFVVDLPKFNCLNCFRIQRIWPPFLKACISKRTFCSSQEGMYSTVQFMTWFFCGTFQCLCVLCGRQTDAMWLLRRFPFNDVTHSSITNVQFFVEIN